VAAAIVAAATEGLPWGVIATAATEAARATAAAAAAPRRRTTAGIVGVTAGAAVPVPVPIRVRRIGRTRGAADACFGASPERVVAGRCLTCPRPEQRSSLHVGGRGASTHTRAPSICARPTLRAAQTGCYTMTTRASATVEPLLFSPRMRAACGRWRARGNPEHAGFTVSCRPPSVVAAVCIT